MRTNLLLLTMSLSLSLTTPLHAQSTAHEHGGQIFHAFHLAIGGGIDKESHHQVAWHLDGWIGTDEHKLWLSSEGERSGSELEKAEFFAGYSRNISTFWDVQVGIRHDAKPESMNYAAVGFVGLAPYFFETAAHLFISEEGDVSARLVLENELLFTQRLILEPSLELNAQAQERHAAHLGAGITDAELGLQLRYEFTRKFAPYLEVKYARDFGKTADFARQHGESVEEIVGMAGIRWLF